MVKVSYQCRDGGAELVNHEHTVSTYQEVCELIDSYPWVREAELFEQYGEGGALFFALVDPAEKHAYFQLTPLNANEALLDLSVVAKKGNFGFGRQAVERHFDVVSVDQAKDRIKELFGHSIDSLYKKYKD